MSEQTRDLTVLKLLAKGRTVAFIANACDLMPCDVDTIAITHGVIRPSGSVDKDAAAAAATKLEGAAAPQVRTREPAAPPAPPAPAPAVVVPTEDDVLLTVPIGDVRPDPLNLRDGVGDVRDLAASLAEVGMLQPIVVRRGDRGRLIVVAGHRRLAAARHAGWTTVPVIVRRAMRPDAVIAAMLVENGHRRDLDPIEEARGLRRLQVEAGGCTHAELGRRVGRHQTHVSARLALLALSVEDQEALRTGDMKLVEATEKARLNAGRVRPKRPDAAYFGAGHPLAPNAKARCRRLHPRVVTMPGGVACGPCWTSVIRADERDHMHTSSAARGACVLCDAPISPAETTRARTA